MRYDDHMGMKVLRTVYLDSDLDSLLSSRATSEGVTKSELIRRYCRQGLEGALEQSTQMVTCDNCDEKVYNRWAHWVGDNPSAPHDEWSCQAPDWKARAKKAEAQVEFTRNAYKRAFNSDPSDFFESGPTQAKQFLELKKKQNICQNCGKPDPNNDHWDDLDGPNVAGWACP